MFQIDFFELCFLAEACIPPRPIARSMFWDSLINVHYHKMTPNERKRIFEWVLKNDFFKWDNEDCKLFAARFDPANQFKATTKCKGKIEVHDCFKWEGKMHIDKNTSVQEDYIIKSHPI